MPSKKKSCDVVQQAIAGPTADHVMEAIRSEYWLPASPPRAPGKDATQPDQPTTTKPQVKP